MIINEFISAFGQVLVFSLIPFLVYVIQKRSVKGFFCWIGLKSAPGKSILMALGTSGVFIIAGLGLAFFSEEMRKVLFDPHSVSGKIRALGFSPNAVVILLLIAWIKTSLSEEIFFRGFVAKRLMAWLGYEKGNLIQSLIFGLVHLVLFMTIMKAGIPFIIFIFVFSTIAGYLIGFIKEKYGHGSILPGWVAHGFGNMVSYWVIAFVL